jgi:hypothetical protein
LNLTAAPFAVITSQTCDIGATGQGRLHPTVQVCPLVLLTGRYSGERIAEINLGKVGYLAPITAPPEPGSWAADLRISLPVSKAVLVAQTRTSCFAQEVETLMFAERVASRILRPALHDAISDGLVTGLRQEIKASQKADQWPDKIEQFRLCVHQGDRLEPKRVQVYVVAIEPLTLLERQPLRAWRKRENKRLMKMAGIELNPMRFIDLSRMTAMEHRSSCPLHVPELGTGAFS